MSLSKLFSWLHRDSEPEPISRPSFELRAVNPDAKRQGTGRRLDTFDTLPEALAAFRTTKARPGHRLEVVRVQLFAMRDQAKRVPAIDPECLLPDGHGRAPLETTTGLDEQLFAPPRPLEGADRVRILPVFRPTGDYVTALAGLQPRNEPHEDGHACDSDGKLVDVGRGEFVRTCSVCGVER
jgi:hypothetical protein